MKTSAHQYLSEKGVKPSVQRIAVMDYLLTHKTHPTADEIYNALSDSIPTLSKTTVYNTLKLLAQQNAVLSLDIDEKNTHYDGDTSPHAHFRCTECGMIYDVSINESPDATSLQNKGFKVLEAQINYKGICPKCNRGN